MIPEHILERSPSENNTVDLLLLAQRVSSITMFIDEAFPILIFLIISSISIASCPIKNLTASLIVEMMYTVSTAF